MSSGSDLTGRFPGIVAITFDGDGTLWDFEKAMTVALARSAETLSGSGLRYGGGPVEAGWLARVRDEVADSAPFKGASMEAIRLAAFEEAIRRCGSQLNLAQSVYRQYMKDRFAELRPYADAVDSLSALQRRFQLALVTNGNTHPTRLGLEERFAEVVIAFECGIEKPDPGIYVLAMERLGVEADACVHVGDDPNDDVQAARQAGMHSIWINREKKPWPDSISAPEAEIRELSSLLDLL